MHLDRCGEQNDITKRKMVNAPRRYDRSLVLQSELVANLYFFPLKIIYFHTNPSLQT